MFGANPPTKAELWFETEEKESDVYNAFVTSYDDDDAALESDASSWSNDSGLTSFKISKTFTVANNCVVPLRIIYNKFVPNAYLYIDPLPVVT